MFAFLIKLGVLLVTAWVIVTVLFLLSYRSNALAEGAAADEPAS